VTLTYRDGLPTHRQSFIQVLIIQQCMVGSHYMLQATLRTSRGNNTEPCQLLSHPADRDNLKEAAHVFLAVG